MNSLYYIIPFAALAVVLFLLYRRSRPKLVIPQNPYSIVGCWDLRDTPEKIWKLTPLGIGIWYSSEASAHHHGDIAAAVDRAFMRLMNDIPREYTKFKQPGDYMLLICDETYTTPAGYPALKVTPVPMNLKGTIYDKGGFVLAAGVTVGVLGDRQVQPPMCILPNIRSIESIEYIEEAAKHEFEHRVAEQDADFHAYKAQTEQHPFYVDGERRW